MPSRHTDVTLLKATLLLSFFWSFERKTYTWSSPKSSKWNAALFIWNAALFIWNAALFIWKALHFSYEKHLKSLKTADSTQISHLDLVFHRVQREGHSWKAPLFMWKVPLFERPLARNCNPMFFSFLFGLFYLFIYFGGNLHTTVLEPLVLLFWILGMLGFKWIATFHFPLDGHPSMYGPQVWFLNFSDQTGTS